MLLLKGVISIMSLLLAIMNLEIKNKALVYEQVLHDGCKLLDPT